MIEAVIIVTTTIILYLHRMLFLRALLTALLTCIIQQSYQVGMYYYSPILFTGKIEAQNVLKC